MSTTKTYKGFLIQSDSYNGGSGLYIANDKGVIEDPLADSVERDIMSYGKYITARYATRILGVWPKTLDEVAADFISQLDGEGVANYGDRYSEYTGYLWTDEELKIGGHDLIQDLKYYTGMYVWIEFIYNKEAP